MKGKIEFKDVWFRYPTRKEDWVLRGLNLTILPNETVALVGESGCGKSTFVALLMRFYDIDQGQILIDGCDVRDYNLHSLRAAMGMVMQEPILFNYSIKENILYGKINAKNSELVEATEISNASEFIKNKTFSDNTLSSLAQNMDVEIIKKISSSELLNLMRNNEKAIIDQIGSNAYDDLQKSLNQIMKNETAFQAIDGDIDQRKPELKDVEISRGFDTLCGIKGCKLSGGQKQRVAIARSVIRKPKILILDEATSALDEDSQKKVQVALDNIMTQRTSIIIAHRLSTIEKCDKIFVLESGKLIESGGFQELFKKETGYFKNLSNGAQLDQK